MTEHELLRRFPNASRATIKANVTPGDSGEVSTPEPEPAKRIRQSSKPVMNKLEQEWFDILNAQYPNFPRPRAQAVRLKIGNGAWYKGDIASLYWPVPMGPAMPTIWECKGPKEMKNVARGILAIKSAAHQWPEIAFWLVWKENGEFRQQRVLP